MPGCAQMIKPPTPKATRPTSAIKTNWALLLLSMLFTPALFVGVVVADELLLAALGGPILPPWTTDGVGGFETLAALTLYWSSDSEPLDLSRDLISRGYKRNATLETYEGLMTPAMPVSQ